MGISLSRKRADSDQQTAVETQSDFPVHGALGLSEQDKFKLKSTWDSIGDINKRRQFIAAFLFNIMTTRQSLKPLFRVDGVSDADLPENDTFKTHIGNFSGIFRVVLDSVQKKIGGVKRKARSLGVAHRRFKEVKFDDDNWIFMADTFVSTLDKFAKLSADDKQMWRRFLLWFFTQMHRSYETGDENIDSD